MTIEVKIAAFAIGLGPDQGVEHADHLRAFLIDGRGVEIVDLDKTFGAHGMGERAVILAELTAPQRDHIADTRDRFGSHIGGELLVAEDGQAFLQAQLEPVAAGDPVAGPVVKILMSDDRLNTFEICISRRLWRCKNGRRVENVQALVLHRAHVEVIDSDDIEEIEVIFTPVSLLVPAHGQLQRVHPESAFANVIFAHVNIQIDSPARGGGEAVGMGDQIASHEGEQICRFRPWIVPFGPAVTACHRVAVGQHHRQIAFDPHREHRHHVGAVGVIGDLAKALGLALGAIHAVRHIKTFKRGVRLGADLDLCLPGERRVGHIATQAAFGQDRRDFRAVDPGPFQVQLFAVQKEIPRCGVRVGRKPDPAEHAGRGWRKTEGQMHLLDQIGGGCVVL